MIGDGVNDVLSLKKANLAVAMASGSQATRGVADIILTNDSFAALAPAVEEGQRILNGMFDILRLFLARIATMGTVILSALVVGTFPISLRNASLITLFSVGIPSALLAVRAQPGQNQMDTLRKTIVRSLSRRRSSAACSALVLFGSIALQLVAASPAIGLAGTARSSVVVQQLPIAQSALTCSSCSWAWPGGLRGTADPVAGGHPGPQLRLATDHPGHRARPGFLALIVVEPLRGIFELYPLDPGSWRWSLPRSWSGSLPSVSRGSTASSSVSSARSRGADSHAVVLANTASGGYKGIVERDRLGGRRCALFDPRSSRCRVLAAL